MRNTLEIEIWMKRKKITVAQIQRALEFANHGVVGDTIAGRRNNRRVLQYLFNKGCPARYLGLPADMREAA
ncbi:MAG: XRE family transcriptional regulator [Thermodesulfobacteriota bacterium]